MEGLGLTVISNFSDKKVLITGANGFIGSHIAKRLVKEGASVNIFIRENSNQSRIKDILSKLKIWYGDISDYVSVKECIQHSKPLIIFHLAGMRDVTREASLIDLMIDINIKGTMNIARAAIDTRIKLESFVNTGSSEEYGNGTAPFSEKQREQPVSPYSASKVAATYFCQMLHRSMGFPSITLRPFLTYGPDQDADMFIPSLIQHCFKKNNFQMTSGEQTRDFVFVDDVVEAYLLAASKPEAIGGIFNIGTGIECSIKDIAEKIVKIMGNPIKLVVGVLPKRQGEAGHFYCSKEKTTKLLGWSPEISLEEGLSRTISWYSENLEQTLTGNKSLGQ